MSAAETLREAAALMRERAEMVTSGAQWTDGHYWITDYDPSDPSGQTAMQRLIGGMDSPDAGHYSSWHPAVALAVADWLDHCAQFARWREHVGDGPTADLIDRAVATATAYLGASP